MKAVSSDPQNTDALVKLIYYEAYILESDAKRREKYLKGGNGKESLKTQLKNYFNKNGWKTSPLS